MVLDIEKTCHHIELLGLRNQLHAAVIDNDLVVCDAGVLGRDFAAGLQKQPVCQLHDIGLVNCRDLLPVVEISVLEGVLCDSFRTEFCDHLGYQRDIRSDFKKLD